MLWDLGKWILGAAAVVIALLVAGAFFLGRACS
jgi:hypothetical protein